MTHRATTIRLDQAFLRIGPSSDQGSASDTATTSSGTQQPEGAFEAPAAQTGPLFRPALEVEQFAPSAVVKHLLGGRTHGLAPCLIQLRESIPERPRIIGFAAGESRQGCTTTVLLAAFELARAGERVLAIDCAPDHGLAAALGVAIEQGWEEAVLARTPLREVTIRSIQDGFDVLPSRGPSGSATYRLPALRLPVEYGKTYDWILVDFGTFFALPHTEGEQLSVRPEANRRDGAARLPLPLTGCSDFIAVQRVDSAMSVISELRKRGNLLGVIETFVPQHAWENTVEIEREAA